MRVLLLVFITLIFFGELKSQVFAGVNLSYKLSTIYNQNNYGQKEMDVDDPLLDYFQGVQLGYRINQNHMLFLSGKEIYIGQDYFDSFNNGNYHKRVILNYFSFPLTYRYTYATKSDQYLESHFYIEGGVHLNVLREGQINYRHNGKFNDAIGFLTDNYENPHEELLESYAEERDLRDPLEFYNKLDYGLHYGMGVQRIIKGYFMVSIGVQISMSLADINAEDWQLVNRYGEYSASKNLYGGLEIKLSYLFHDPDKLF